MLTWHFVIWVGRGDRRGSLISRLLLYVPNGAATTTTTYYYYYLRTHRSLSNPSFLPLSYSLSLSLFTSLQFPPETKTHWKPVEKRPRPPPRPLLRRRRRSPPLQRLQRPRPRNLRLIHRHRPGNQGYPGPRSPHPSCSFAGTR